MSCCSVTAHPVPIEPNKQVAATHLFDLELADTLAAVSVRGATEPELTPNVLANVLVHEITHILQGPCWHSDTGVMKARWTHTDYMEIGRKRRLGGHQQIVAVVVGNISQDEFVVEHGERGRSSAGLSGDRSARRPIDAIGGGGHR